MSLIAAPRHHRLARTISACLACAPVFTGSAFAADAETATVAAPDPQAATTTAAAPQTPPQTLDRVMVTAQKREQAAIDVPASIAAVNAERLAKGGLSRLEDYAAQIPGMSITSDGGSMQVALRGISTGLSQAAPTTAIYIDEAPIGSVNAYAAGSRLAPDLDPADLRQIEVLKGPQGTLFGAGAMGGVLRYVTQAPDFDTFGGSVTVGVNRVADGGTGNLARFALNVPTASENLAFRVSAFNRNEAGYIDNPQGSNDFNKVDLRGGRAALAWKLGENWTLSASALTQRREAAGGNGYEIDINTLVPTWGERVQPLPFDVENDSRLDVYNLTLRGYLGRYTLVSSTTYQTLQARTQGNATRSYGTLLALVLADPDYAVRSNQNLDTRRWAQELRLESTAFDDRLYYSGGAYFTSEDSQNRIPAFDTFSRTTGAPRTIFIPGTTIPFPDGLAKARIDTRYKEVSVFANATWSITDAFDLQGGLRYGEDRQDYDQLYTGLLFTPAVSLVQHSKNDKFTWLLSARYKPSDTDALYLRLANGYRAGGPSAATPITGASPVVGPDALTSVEAGWKSVRADGLVSLEMALFHTKWKDIQIQTSAAGSQFFVNGGTAVSQGGEATLGLYPVDGLSLRLSAGYTDAQLTEDTGKVILDPGTPAQRPLGRDGDHLPFVPKVSASLASDYEWSAWAGWTAAIGGSLNYMGKRDSDYSGRTRIDVPAYTTLNLHASLGDQRWLFTLYAKNLGDEDGILYLADTGLAPFTPNAPYVAGMIRPRTIGLEVAYRF